MLKRGFLSRKQELTLTRRKITFGVAIAAGYAICFYQVAIGFREIIRLSKFPFGAGSFLLLSPSEAFYHNFFFAFWACLLGFANAIWYWMTATRRPKIGRYRILNDSTNVLSVFTFWFGKLSVLYGLFCISIPIFYNIDFYRDYFYLFPLIGVVLFLNQWLHFRRFVRYSFRWMGISLAIMLSLSTVLAFSPVIALERANGVADRNKIGHFASLLLPSSETQMPTFRRQFVFRLSIGYTPKSDTVMAYNDFYVTAEHLPAIIQREKEWQHEMERDRIQLLLYCDKNVRTRFIKNLTYQLRLLDQRHVKFVTDSTYFATGISLLLRPVYAELIPPGFVPLDEVPRPLYSVEWMSRFYQPQKSLVVGLYGDRFVVNGHEVDRDELKRLATEKYLRGESIELEIDDHSSYQSYVSLYDALFVAFHNVRVDAVREKFGVEFTYDTDDAEIMRFLREKYSLRIFEWSDGEKEAVLKLLK